MQLSVALQPFEWPGPFTIGSLCLYADVSAHEGIFDPPVKHFFPWLWQSAGHVDQIMAATNEARS